MPARALSTSTGTKKVATYSFTRLYDEKCRVVARATTSVKILKQLLITKCDEVKVIISPNHLSVKAGDFNDEVSETSTQAVTDTKTTEYREDRTHNSPKIYKEKS